MLPTRDTLPERCMRTGELTQSLTAPDPIRTVVTADAHGVTLLAGRFLLRLGR